MKKANKWILGAAVAVLAVTLSYKVIASITVKGIKSNGGAVIKLQVNNKSPFTMVVTGGTTSIDWPTSISSETSKTAQITLQENTVSNVLYGPASESHKYPPYSDCVFTFYNINGTISVTGATIGRAECSVAKGSSSGSVIIQIHVVS